MNTGDGLLAAILDQPKERTLYRIFADWLEENGDGEWASFIRNCVDPQPGFDRRQQGRYFKSKWLGAANIAFPASPDFPGVPGFPGVRVDMGMLQSVALPDAYLFCQRLDAGLTALFRHHPIQKVTFWSVNGPTPFMRNWRDRTYLCIDGSGDADRWYLPFDFARLLTGGELTRYAPSDGRAPHLRVQYRGERQARKAFSAAYCRWRRELAGLTT